MWCKKEWRIKMDEQKIDLFETLVRFLAVKPLKFDTFDLEQAQGIVKKEREGAITFIGEHGYFEELLDTTAKKATNDNIQGGTLYIFVKGDGCTERMRRNLVEILMGVRSVVIFGDAEKWMIVDPKIKYVDHEDIFTDNHQRFFIYQSPAYNVALVSRHEDYNGEVAIEAALSNASDAVSLLSQTVGTHLYHASEEA
jgi:hypothetical protein